MTPPRYTPKADNTALQVPKKFIPSSHMFDNVNPDITDNVNTSNIPYSYLMKVIGESPGKLTEKPVELGLDTMNVKFSRNGEVVPGNFILGGDFIKDTPTAYKARVYKNILKKSPNQIYYGTANNKLNIGDIGKFKNNTFVVPATWNGAYDSTTYERSSENSSRMHIWQNGKKQYNNLRSISGKILLYDNTTGKKVFVEGTPEDVAKSMNSFKEKNPNANYILLDNGRFNSYLYDKKGLTKADYLNYYQLDLHRTPGIGYNLVAGLKTHMKGGKMNINIKKNHEGLFTKYCKGDVTPDCIQKGLHSKDPKIRARARFAQNASKWKHKSGGILYFHKK